MLNKTLLWESAVPEIIGFTEVQKFRSPWVIAAAVLMSLVAWWGFIQQIIFGIHFGSHPAPDYVMFILVAIFGIGLPLFILTFRMHTILGPDFILIKMTLLGKHLIPLSGIKKCYSRQYRPILEYGGWGIRWSPSKGVAYNVTGNQGVQLEMINGRKILIGSREAEQLSQMINSLLK